MMNMLCGKCGKNTGWSGKNSHGVCGYCRNQITFPLGTDEKYFSLFNQATNYRIQGEYDKAVAGYEMILTLDDSSAEANWGRALSRWGIGYVLDPETNKYIPVCYKGEASSILTDPDYLDALEFAPDESARALYEKEASRIAKLRSPKSPKTEEGGKRSRPFALIFTAIVILAFAPAFLYMKFLRPDPRAATYKTAMVNLDSGFYDEATAVSSRSTETHSAIIDQATYDAAQEALMRITEKWMAGREDGEKGQDAGQQGDPDRSAAVHHHAFTSMIRCPRCGKRFRHVTNHGRSGWACPTFIQEGKSACHSKRIPNDVLRETTCQVLGWDRFDEGRLRETVDHITAVYPNGLVYRLKDGREIEAEWAVRSRSDNWMPEMRSKAAEDGRRRWAG